MRGLLLNTPDAGKIIGALVWRIGIMAVFVPLSIWSYGCRVTS